MIGDYFEDSKECPLKYSYEQEKTQEIAHVYTTCKV
jgi:hypothetical protein